MKKLELKGFEKMTREQMKNVSGGAVGGTCSISCFYTEDGPADVTQGGLNDCGDANDTLNFCDIVFGPGTIQANCTCY